MSFTARLLPFSMMLLCWATPAMAQSREQRQMMADIRMLQEQTQELAVALASLSQALQESVRSVNSRLAETDTSTRRALADQKVAIDELGKDTRAVRERVDDTNIRVSNIREELEARGSIFQTTVDSEIILHLSKRQSTAKSSCT